MKLINEAKRLQKLAGILNEGEENDTSILGYLHTLYDMIDLGDDYKPGRFTYIFDREEYADPDLYDDANMFEPAFEYVKNKGKVVIKGYMEQPIFFTTRGNDIEISFDVD